MRFSFIINSLNNTHLLPIVLPISKKDLNACSIFSSEATCSISCIGFLGFQQYLKANDTPTEDLDDYE